ncbi:MAG: hypothetical protein H6633_06735 [Anaerolineales bacterium]|nr:hypothetical protein [Anaerolineales bacterium]
MLAEETEYLFELDDEALACWSNVSWKAATTLVGRISFRLVGPTTGRNNLFAWDSGYGPASHGDAPELFVSVGPAPAETPCPTTWW